MFRAFIAPLACLFLTGIGYCQKESSQAAAQPTDGEYVALEKTPVGVDKVAFGQNRRNLGDRICLVCLRGAPRRGLSSRVHALSTLSFACPSPCHFRAVNVELHRTSRVRCHLPRSKYM